VSLGPIFECPIGLEKLIPEIARSNGIQVESVERCEPNACEKWFVFTTRFGRIVGHLDSKEGAFEIWLSCPREHAFNLLFWVADFGLSRRIEKFLCESGAVRVV
jgi:hypothetical protein